MTRLEEIRAALAKGYELGTIDGHYIQSGMPGRRWTVWGTAVGAFEYPNGGAGSMSCERSYDTRGVESMLRSSRLLT